MAKLWAIILLLVLLVVHTMAVWHRSNFPSPQDTTKDECSRKGKRSWVCDPAQKLSYEEANQLDNTIQKIANITKCACSEHVCKNNRRGYHVAIAVAPHILSDAEMKDYAEDHGEYERDYPPNTRLHHIQLFAYTLMKRWNVGKCDDGIIMVFDPENYSLYTVGGKVALRMLTPETIGDITMVNREEFSKGAFQGLQKMLSDYRDVLLNKYSMPIYGHRPRTAAVVGGGGRGGSGAAHVAISGFTVLLMTLVAALW